MRLLFWLFLTLAGSLPAAALDAADRTAIQGVINGQIEAFRRDDAAGAYSFAGPQIRTMFPTEDVFIGMVKRGYPPVYRPCSFAFDTLEERGDNVLAQSVRIQDAEGVDWVALYTLEKQPDGTWKISGCSLVKAPGQTV